MKVLLVGFKNERGWAVKRIINEIEDLECPMGFDKAGELFGYTYFDPLGANNLEDIDVIISFAKARVTLEALRTIALKYKIPMVISTGEAIYKEKEMEEIEEASKIIPIFVASNMCYEVKLISDIVKSLAPKLAASNYDIEISDVNNNKDEVLINGVSKTSFIIANAANTDLDYDIIVNRGEDAIRNHEEIGISKDESEEENVYKEITLGFYSECGKIEIKHTMYSPEMFARGAIRAARFLVETSSAGLYSMDDLKFLKK